MVAAEVFATEGGRVAAVAGGDLMEALTDVEVRA